ncbi:uncharacterized protein LOC135091704 [Scylla paramamosain]|uniref:uncharacterized protein LOC135091704 n=1 Tax=Scylla paramamosain TaxID=85552 RepID=UPI003082AF3F
MCPRGSHRRFLLSLILCLRPASPASQITGSLFEKMDLPSEVLNNCPLTVVPQPPASQHSSTYFCAIQCLGEPACTAFCVSDKNTEPDGAACELVNAVVVPSGSRSQQANGSCFARFRSPWPRGADLARGKAVAVPGAWDDYAEKQTVVSGHKCEVSQYSCFCSSFKIITSSYFTVDLGASQPVAAIVVTVSSYFPDYFRNVEIRVGDKGDSGDPLFEEYTGTPQNGEVLVFEGESTLIGRYVSLIRRDYSLCLCLLQVYSVQGCWNACNDVNY